MPPDRPAITAPQPGSGTDPTIGEIVVLGLVVLATVVPAVFSVLYWG